MKKVLTALIFSICLNHYAGAQTKVDQTQTASGATQTQKTTTAQPPELTEANRLGAQVVKLYREGKYDEALPLAKREVELREKALGPETQAVATSVFNLASLYQAKKNYHEAEPLFQRSLAVYEKSFGTDNLRLYPVLESYAFALFGNRKYSEAQQQLKRAVSIRESALGDESLEVARSLYTFGQLSQAIGDYGEALSSYGQAGEISEKVIGLESVDKDKITIRTCPDLTKIRQKETQDLIVQASKAQPKQSGTTIKKPDVQKSTVNNGDFAVVKEGVINGKAIRKPVPDYPGTAKAARITGPVVVKILVDETGKVIESEAVCGHSVLSGAAVSAARNVRFSPTTLSGVPVKVSGTVTYNFMLQ